MKQSRLFKILYYLLLHKSTTAKELAELCEVSVRTIYRDMDELSLAGVPIYVSRGKNGGIHIIEEYSFDKSIIDESERHILLDALKATRHLFDSDGNLELKLRSVFENNQMDWLSIDLSRWGNYSTDTDKFNLLKNSIMTKKEIKFIYCNVSSKITHKKVRPNEPS